jgi:two-component system, OmpR family, response regulator
MNYKKKSRNFSKNRGRSMNRILVVEDDPQLQLLYRSVLERAGFSVITALNGEDALKKLEATHIELIITDVMMPEMDGYDLVGSLRNARFDMPVLMITAKADSRTRNVDSN